MTECAQCGDCCENMTLTLTKVQARAIVADPLRCTADRVVDAQFFLDHWHRVGGARTGTTWSCDRFDTETRTCTAHDDRPPVCRGYPWYEKEPDSGRHLSKRCSFWADIHAAQRPPGVQPVTIGKRTAA